MTKAKVFRWGKSLAVLLPEDIVKDLNLSIGDDVRIDPLEGRELEISRTPDQHAGPRADRDDNR